MNGLAKRVQDYIQQTRDERGDVAMGCVRLEAQAQFMGIVYEKPGGSSAQYEASYDPGLGFLMMTPEGEAIVEPDPERVYEQFRRIIEEIPAQRRTAIEQKIAEWRDQGFTGSRLLALIMSFNSHYDGTRGGELAPEELRFAARLSAS